MSHTPSFADYRIGIEAAVQMRQSSTAFAFLQRIQQYQQQRQLSEIPLVDPNDSGIEIDPEAFYSVMTCSLQTGDCALVQRTFDELKATVGVAGLEHKAGIMLLQVRLSVFW